MRKVKTTSFQPDPELIPILKQWAENEDRSVSWIINYCLREYLVNKGMIKPKTKNKKPV